MEKYIAPPKYIWIAGFIGVCINDIFYFSSFKHAPAAQVDLIKYTWPIVMTILIAIVNKKRPDVKRSLALIVAFTGIYILLTDNKNSNFSDFYYLEGYILAFLSALSWVVYLMASKKYERPKIEMIAILNLLGTIFAITMHLKYEKFVMPNKIELLSAITIGILSRCFAYLFWDHAEKGNDKIPLF